MRDMLTIISSDSRFPLDATGLLRGDRFQTVRTFRSAQECFRAFDLEGEDCKERVGGARVRRLVVVDSEVSDISPLNLCDSLRTRYADIDVLLVVAERSAESVQRAMLAGARATIERDASPEQFVAALRQVRELGLAKALPARHGYAQAAEAATSVLVPVIGARGGAGRSTVASLLAALAAQSGVDTALVDFDLQFGDLGFLFGRGEGSTLGDFVRALDEGTGQARRFRAP